MINDHVSGIGSSCFWNPGDVYGQKGSCKADSKVNKVGAYLLQNAIQIPVYGRQRWTFSPLRLLFWLSLFVGARTQQTGLFPATFELSSLDGTNGFTINGEAAGDTSGFSLSSAGDVNGDGIDDILIGAIKADSSGRSNTGKSYVVFGSRSNASRGVIELANLDGTKGFIINGKSATDNTGFSVSSAGDVNADGINDIVIGANKATPQGRTDAGKVYVVFGTRSVVKGGVLEPASLDGTNGFTINGEAASDTCGVSVSSGGDVNGDGIDDIVIGANGADPSGRTNAGKCYVIFGTRSVISGGVLELANLNGNNGFTINGKDNTENAGRSVSSSGDVNGDGINDIVIGAPLANPSGRSRAGKSYVVFGTRSIFNGGVLELANLNGINGFSIHGEMASDWSGISVSSSGDFNGDGIDDIVIGAYRAALSGRSRAGKSYVLFGRRSVVSGGVFELAKLNGRNGFTLNGEAKDDYSGISVSSEGDVNGDGIDDLLIGAYGADPSGRSDAGKSYVVFGTSKIVSAGILELASLNGKNGFIINGVATRDTSGRSVSTEGDINGDGINDIVIGANGEGSTGSSITGKSYVLFGRSLAANSPTPPLTEGSTTSPPSYALTSFIHSSTSHFLNSIIMEVTTSSQQSSGQITELKETVTTNVLPRSSSANNTPLIVGIAVAVAAFVCSLFTGCVYFAKRSSRAEENNGVIPLADRQSNPAFPVGNAATDSAFHQTQQISRNNEYYLMLSGNPSSSYKSPPKSPPPHSTDHYDKDLSQLNRNMENYQTARTGENPKMQSARVDNTYNQLPGNKSSGGYKSPPKEFPQSTKKDYHQDLGQLNWAMENYLEAKTE